MVGAYAPVFLVVGIRGLPHPAAIAACVVAMAGLAAWVFIVRRLTTAQPRTVQVEESSAIDGEVTAYIVSLLLPAVAAGTPSAQDWVAYTVCAVLVLIVAWGAHLWSVNPVVYLLGLRVIRITINGEPVVALARSVPTPGTTAVVARAVGVVRVLNADEAAT